MRVLLSIRVHKHFVLSTIHVPYAGETHVEFCISGRDFPAAAMGATSVAQLLDLCHARLGVQGEYLSTFPYPAFLHLDVVLPFDGEAFEIVSARFGETRGTLDFTDSFRGSSIPEAVRKSVINNIAKQLDADNVEAVLKIVDTLCGVSKHTRCK